MNILHFYRKTITVSNLTDMANVNNMNNHEIEGETDINSDSSAPESDVRYYIPFFVYIFNFNAVLFCFVLFLLKVTEYKNYRLC